MKYPLPHLLRPADPGHGAPSLGIYTLYQPNSGGWPIAVAVIGTQMVFYYDRAPQRLPSVSEAELQISSASPDDALQALAYLCAQPASGSHWYQTSDTHRTSIGDLTLYLRIDN
jgi:hypothetical protein